MMLLKVSGVSKRVDDNFVLDRINFSQRKLQKIAVAGETGSGKSTLLKIIAGLDQRDDGEVLFSGKLVPGPGEKLVPGHDEIAYLSQHFELQKFLRVEQILSYANRLTDDHAAMLFEVCRISHLLKRKTDELSGGERQRIGLARLLIGAPKLLLLDEPFTNLDMVHKNILKDVIDDVGKKLKITCILVSHDPADTLSWADRIIVLKGGHVVQQGTPEKIYRKPANEYVAGLFGKYTVLSPSLLSDFNRLKIKSAGKKLIVRPENFSIAKNKLRTIPGKISAVIFFGSHYEVEVSLKEIKVSVITKDGNFKIGKKVNLALSMDNKPTK
jgi:iron(III) transport system ATP-binding protein